MSYFYPNNMYGPGVSRGAMSRFETQYNCYSMAVLGRSNIDDGDKIILPPSALDEIAQMNVEYPLLFELSRGGKKTHCGVLEFSAEEGKCYMPFWMMKNLDLTEGVIVNVKNTSLSKATFVKFKPQSVDFLDISNPRVVLENALRKFTCLTVDDIIQINYAGVVYSLRVVELKPQNAVSIVETDCEVDFEEPVGYKESKYYKAEMEHRERALSRLSDSDSSTKAPRVVQKAKVETESDNNKQPTFEAFTGKAQRIDGKAPPAKDGIASSSANTSAKQQAAAAAMARFSAPTSSANASSTTNGTTSSEPPKPIAYQSRIGDKYSRIKSSSSAFTGNSNKLS